MCSKSVKFVSWSEAKKPLSRALGDYTERAGAAVANGHEYSVLIEGAYVHLRAEGNELVIVGFTGEHRLKAAAPVIFELAKRIHARSIRLHTERRGECRYLNRIGFPFVLTEQRGNEQVLRMVLDGR